MLRMINMEMLLNASWKGWMATHTSKDFSYWYRLLGDDTVRNAM